MEKRYYVSQYGRYLYVIIDSENMLAVRKKGKESITSQAYDSDGAVFLTFKNAADAQKKCDELNKGVE